jgi:transposase-like protein
MHPTQAHVDNLPRAFEIIKDMNRSGQWGEDLTDAARKAVATVLETRMNESIDQHLAEIEQHGESDRRNGGYCRHLLTGLGDVELHVPRTRTYSANDIVGTYVRRAREVDRTILSCFVLGHSTRKVSKALQPMLGERFSASTVSKVAKMLDATVAAFHARALHGRYQALLLDGVVLARKTGAGAIRRPVLVAVGLLKDGRKEVIDFRLARAESEQEWESFLTDMRKRGFSTDDLKIIIVDGGRGLLNALPTVFPNIPIQRCWAHKVRNLTDKVRRGDQKAVKRGLRRIYDAASEKKARKMAGRFAAKWERKYPKVVHSLREDLDELLAFFLFKDPAWRKWTRTTNAIERRFREVRRRTRPMGVFTDRTSMDRILYAVFTHENQQQKVSTLFLVTQNS